MCKQTTTEICLEVKMLHTHELMFTRALEDSVKKDAVTKLWHNYFNSDPTLQTL